MTFPYENVLAHVLFADSAQPRKARNVTRPFPILWVGSGDETKPYSLVPRPLPLRGRGSGDIRAISWANKMAARRNVNAPIRLQNYGDVTQL